MIPPSAAPRNAGDAHSAHSPAQAQTKHDIEGSPTRPIPLRLEPDGIPLELRRYDHWVAWRYELVAGKNGLKRWTKVPTIAQCWRDPKPGGNAKSTDPLTWTNYDRAIFYHFEHPGSDGISFVFSRDDPFCGVDLDDAIDSITGRLQDWARPIVADLDSYTEISPSGTGVKIFLEGVVPGSRRKKGAIEMYDTDRLFTVTGHHLPGTPETVNHRPDALRRLYEQTFGALKPTSTSQSKTSLSATPLPPPTLLEGGGPDDDELIRLASAAPNGAKFTRLWNGDWTGYDSQSNADLALCAILAYWCRRDTARIDALFRRSDLYRVEKWRRRSYREPTLRKAIQGCARVYGGPTHRTQLFTPEELAKLGPLIASLDSPDTPCPSVTVQPSVPIKPPTGENRLYELDKAATESSQPQATVWAAAYTRGPAVYIDQSPPAEPAYVVRETLARAGIRRSLTVLRSSRDTAEAATTLAIGDGTGLQVAAYPKRSPENCKNLEEVHLAEGIGLSAGAAVCPTCAYNTLGQCLFQKEMTVVKEADHRVATSARAATSLADLGRDVDAVFLMRDALDVLAPHTSVGGLRAEHFTLLVHAASRGATKARFKGRSPLWWLAFRQLVEAVALQFAKGSPAAITITLASVKKPPSLWAVSLWNVLRGPDGRPPKIPPGLIRLIAAGASGRLRTLNLQPSEDGSSLRLVGVWLPRLPPGVAVFAVEVLESTALAGTGVSAVDITVAAPPAWTARAVQIPRRRTAQQRPGSAAKLIRGFMMVHPGERLCVLLPGRRERAEELAKGIRELLSPDEAAQVNLFSWHGSVAGEREVKDSNALTGCDRVIGLGIPTVPPSSIRRRLTQTGNYDGARESGDWGSRIWNGHRGDGADVRVDARGYRHAAWHKTYVELVRDLLRRRLVGVTVPVVLMSDMELDLPLIDSPPSLTPKDLRLLQMLHAEMEGGAQSAKNARGYIEDISPSKSCRFDADQNVGISTAALARAAGMAARTAGCRLAVLERAGLVAAVRSERGRLRGWVAVTRMCTHDEFEKNRVFNSLTGRNVVWHMEHFLPMAMVLCH